MTIRWDVLLAIIGMAAATYLCRAGGYALWRALRPPPFFQAMLQHMPGCIFVAFLVPKLTAGGWPEWLAAAAVVATQAALRRLWASMVAGVAVLWGVRVVVGVG